ncbi:unnamed protein product [Onchocerca ochengi]|uniref:PITH domain-containing protein n=1 Tax=Onchocerca ochengi TaxID=42157 RepID=A0A182DWQ2_ONCOC|nr:unnamed protein product [Onchocerca ochengi]
MREVINELIPLSVVSFRLLSSDINEELHPAYLTLADYDREQKMTSPSTAITFQKDNQEVFPEFPQQIDSELTSVTDDAMSVATNISEEEQQLLVFDTVEDDIFNDEIAVAEEAFADEVMSKPNKVRKNLKKQVNVVSALLSDLNVVISSLNNASKGAGYITKHCLGFKDLLDTDWRRPLNRVSISMSKLTEDDPTRIVVQQSFDKELGDIYAAINNQENNYSSERIPANNGKTTVNFQFYSFSNGQPSSVKVQIEGFRATLDDIILMHLSAFIYDDQKTNVPLNLKINLIDTQIIVRIFEPLSSIKKAFLTIITDNVVKEEVINCKHYKEKDTTTNPFRIKLNDCVIEQTVEEDENS